MDLPLHSGFVIHALPSGYLKIQDENLCPCPDRESYTATIDWVICQRDVKSQKVLLTCLIASSEVTVFPVPQGPNTRYGAGRDDLVTIF